MKGEKNQKSVTNQQTRDRAKHRCPDQLEELLEIVNSIPPDRVLPHIEELKSQAGDDEQKLRAMIKEKMQGKSPKLLLPPGDTRDLETYSFFRFMRLTVRDLANRALLPRDAEFEYQVSLDKPQQRARFARRFNIVDWEEGDPRDYETWPNSTRVPSFTVFIYIDAGSGLTNPLRNHWLEALVGIEAKRLRICDFCRRVFWARQDNMHACSSRCSTANRQRLLREKRKKQYAESAKKKRQTKKAQKARK